MDASVFTQYLIEDLLKENISQSDDMDFKSALASLTKYMLSQGWNITPLPAIHIINNDSENSKKLLGKTAYYSPGEHPSITLYTLGRHDKDALRSYAHEMCHRVQDNEGRLNNINTTDTTQDSNLEELEKEAYLKGNMLFRNWEDSIKNKHTMTELKYKLKEQEEETGLKNLRGKYEWILTLSNITADKFMDMLNDSENLKGTHVLRSKGLDVFLKQVFGDPLATDDVNKTLYKENGNDLYRKIVKEVGTFKKGIPFAKKGEYYFPEKNAHNLDLARKYYGKMSSNDGEKSTKTSLHPSKVNNNTVKFPIADENILKKILTNMGLVSGKDYKLSKQKSEDISENSNPIFKLSPELAFKIYDALADECDMIKDHFPNKSAFFTYLNNKIK